MTRTQFLNRLLSDEGAWPDVATMLAELVAVYGLNTAGFCWPAEGTPVLVAEIPSEPLPTLSYPVIVAQQPTGLFWADVSKQTAAADDLKLLANALGASRTLQRFLGPFAEQGRTAQRLEDAAKVAGRVAHDLDNVFQTVSGYNTLALGMVSPESTVAGFLREVQVSAQRGMDFCVRLHELSRAGNAKPYPGLLQQALAAEMKRLQTNKNKVRVECSVPADLPSIAMDEDGLKQLLGALLNNAVEASAPGTTVSVLARTVELESDTLAEWLGRPSIGPNAEIVIRDYGSAITADNQRRLFVEPFLTTKLQHRGLSLAVVYRMLYAHRGGVRVVSAVGRGTEITVVLPFAAPMFRNHDSRTTRGSSP